VAMGYEALVTAGGFAKRFGGGRSKPLLRHNQSLLVSIAVQSVLEAGCRRVLVTTNRPEYMSELADEFVDVPGVTLAIDGGCESTFELAVGAAARMESEFLFVYGHAPRPPNCIRMVLNTKGPVVGSGFKQSSQQFAPTVAGLRIEAPYRLKKEEIIANTYTSWNSYIESEKCRLNVVPVSGPCEFNYRSELEGYCDYIDRWHPMLR
jgi:hypothetical protein